MRNEYRISVGKWKIMIRILILRQDGKVYLIFGHRGGCDH